MAAKLKNSISYLFILRILPAFFFISVVLLTVLSILEINSAKEASRKAAQGRANNLATMLREPVWQLSMTLSQNILKIVLDTDVICAKLKQKTAMNPDDLLLEKGNCQILGSQESDSVEVFSSEIIHTNLGSPRVLGLATLHVRIDNNWQAISKGIGVLVALSIVLFVLIVAVTFVAFQWTILTPLKKVTSSLKSSSEANKDKPKNWDTLDELGILIHEYKYGLVQQHETETDLETSRKQAQLALASLQEATDRLVQAEKMASLGELVAGVAHEINTPIGNSITVASTIADLSEELEQNLDSGTLKKETLYHYISSLHQASTMLEESLKIAAGLVTSFKQVAADRTSEEHREFDLKEVLDELGVTLRPLFNHTNFSYEILAPQGVMMDSYPGPIGQIVTSCFTNAILHGFDGSHQGHINLTVNKIDKNWLMIRIKDNGKGMSQSELAKAFDPFFTTKRGKGGVGLGLNIVFNIVTTILGGSVKIRSAQGQGTTIKFRLPLKVKVSSK